MICTVKLSCIWHWIFLFLQANISQEEYETKTKLYLQRVAALEQAERDEEEREPKKSLLTFYSMGKLPNCLLL